MTPTPTPSIHHAKRSNEMSTVLPRSTESRPSLSLAPPPLDEIREAARELVRALAEHPGDDEAVCRVLTDWHDRLGYRDLGFVCMAAMRTTFGECLSVHDLDALPPGALLRTPGGSRE